MTDRKKVRLHFFSETGTEGGWYAAQDYDHIKPAPAESPDKVCEQCGYIWGDYKNTPEIELPKFNWRDARGNIKRGDKLPKNTRLGKDPFDIYYIRQNERYRLCHDNGHKFKLMDPHESWSYEGLIMLGSGDKLEILDDEGHVTKTVTCKFISNGDQYAPDAKSAMGLVVHGYIDPEVMDEDEWNTMFLMEKTDAYLTKAEK